MPSRRCSAGVLRLRAAGGGGFAFSTGAAVATTFCANSFCEASSFSPKPNELATRSAGLGRSAANGFSTVLANGATAVAQSSMPPRAISWLCLIAARICS